MKNAVKAVITQAEKTFHTDKVLSLQLDGENYEDVKRFVKLRKLGPGSVILFNINDREARSSRQNRTFHLLVAIALKSELFGDHFKSIKQSFKQSFGQVYDDWKDFAGKWHSDLESTANYSKEQFAKLMSESIEHMLKVFNQNDYYDKRFDEMMQEFNSEEIKPEPKEELEIF